MQQPTESQPEQPAPDQPTGPRIRWLDVRINGKLICQVDNDDRTHVRMMVGTAKTQRKVMEISLKAVSVTGS